MKANRQIANLAVFGPLLPAQQQQSAIMDLQLPSIQRCAVGAVIWRMPAVNTNLVRQEMFRKTTGTKVDPCPKISRSRKRGQEKGPWLDLVIDP